MLLSETLKEFPIVTNTFFLKSVDRINIGDHEDIENILNMRNIEDTEKIEHPGIMHPMYT